MMNGPAFCELQVEQQFMCNNGMITKAKSTAMSTNKIIFTDNAVH